MLGTVYGLVGLIDRVFKKNWQFLIASLLLFAVTEFIGSWLLNSLWLTILYGMPYKAELLLRLPEAVVFFVIKFVFALLIRRFILPIMRKNF